jgi:hypothetical protein
LARSGSSTLARMVIHGNRLRPYSWNAISGMAKPRWNWTMVKPRPLEAANISLITIRMMPIESAWRIPATICGLAERSTRCRSRAGPRMP